jgi:predicted nucleotidyltransferase
MQEVIEGFAVETVEGLIFTVKGLMHPPDRVIAYLRYAVDPAGDRMREGIRYRRVYRFQDQRAILTRYPQYVVDDEILGSTVQTVPRQRIRRVYDPCRAVQTLRDRGARDELEAHALSLVQLLENLADGARGAVGISGSVFLGLHRDRSDLDLVIYGEAVGRAVRRALHDLLAGVDPPLRRPAGEELMALHRAHRPDTPLSFANFTRLQSRKVNELRFRGHEVFLRFVKHPSDVSETYGDRRYEPLGPGTVRARVIDDRDTLFTPCRYHIDDVELIEGEDAGELQTIVSYRGRFCEQGRQGENVRARGSLERVIPRQGKAYTRLIVGGTAGDYMLAEAKQATR